MYCHLLVRLDIKCILQSVSVAQVSKKVTKNRIRFVLCSM